MADSPVVFQRSLLTLATQVLCALCGILNNFILARALGTQGKGETYIVFLLGGIFVQVLVAGLDRAMVYFIGRGIYGREKVLGTTTLLAVFASGLGVGLFVVAPGSWRQALVRGLSRNLQAIALATVPIQSLFLVWAFFALALNRVKLYNLLRAAPSLSFTLMLIPAYFLLGHAVILYAALWLVSFVVACVLGFAMINHHVRIRLRFDRNFAVNGTHFGLKTHLGTLLQLFNYRVDAFILNYWWGGTQVGLYSVAVAVAETLWFIPESAATVIGPEVARRETARANQLTLWVCRNVLWLTGAVAIPLYLLSRWFIGVYLPNFAAAIPVVGILLPGITAMSITRVITSDLNGRGRPLTPSLAAFASTIMALVLYFKLIPHHGLWGAAVASSISYSFSALLSLILFAVITKVRIHQLLLPRIADARYYQELWLSLRTRFLGNQEA